MSKKISFSDETKKHREEKNVQIEKEAKAFNFKSIPGRWTARKDTGLRSKSGFSYVTPAYTAYMRLRGVAVQRPGLYAVLVFIERPARNRCRFEKLLLKLTTKS